VATALASTKICLQLQQKNNLLLGSGSNTLVLSRLVVLSRLMCVICMDNKYQEATKMLIGKNNRQIGKSKQLVIKDMF